MRHLTFLYQNTWYKQIIISLTMIWLAHIAYEGKIRAKPKWNGSLEKRCPSLKNTLSWASEDQLASLFRLQFSVFGLSISFFRVYYFKIVHKYRTDPRTDTELIRWQFCEMERKERIKKKQEIPFQLRSSGTSKCDFKLYSPHSTWKFMKYQVPQTLLAHPLRRWRNSQCKTIPLLFIFRLTSKQHLIWNPFGLVYMRCVSGQSRTYDGHPVLHAWDSSSGEGFISNSHAARHSLHKVNEYGQCRIVPHLP
jgi:hypothetical protein